MINRLKAILLEVRSLSGEEFSGVGVVVYENIENIPIFPLRKNILSFNDDDIVKTLVKISTLKGKYHDGFHLISHDWRLTHISQYFSPPIVKSAKVDYGKPFGGRYIAALFGSSLPDVLFTGIASSEFGIAIFKEGEEVFFEGNP